MVFSSNINTLIWQQVDMVQERLILLSYPLRDTLRNYYLQLTIQFA